jgi:hypothetical protein
MPKGGVRSLFRLEEGRPVGRGGSGGIRCPDHDRSDYNSIMSRWILFFGLSLGVVANECIEIKAVRVGDPTSGKVTVWAL